MILLRRVASEIKHVGLYLRILQEIEDRIGRKNPSEEEILEELRRSPDLVAEYRETNLECNISNIHLKPIEIDALPGECRDLGRRVNEALRELGRLEKYTLDFEKSPVLVMLFTVEFFVIFSVQYFIVLLGWKEWQLEIYGAFALSILWAWWYATRQRRVYAENRRRFDELYASTLERIADLEARGCLDRETMYVERSAEHIR